MIPAPANHLYLTSVSWNAFWHFSTCKPRTSVRGWLTKKENEAEEAFKKQLETVANDPAVKANAALSKLLEAAVKKAEKSESIRSIASNLDTQLRSNFAENELPKAVTSLQLDLARYSAVGANGVVLK